MGLFSRKKSEEDFEKLPELPQLPESIHSAALSRQAPSQIEASSLPSLPQTESAKRWSMQAVKDAVRSPGLDSGNNNFDASSGEEGVMGTPRVPLYMSQSAQVSSASAAPVRREPLFVRIDKFEAALRDFEDISIKIKRIEELITEIRELREKEDREFGEWEKDLQVMKSRMDNIDRTLFSQLD